jgi:hypothetical protein
MQPCCPLQGAPKAQKDCPTLLPLLCRLCKRCRQAQTVLLLRHGAQDAAKAVGSVAVSAFAAWLQPCCMLQCRTQSKMDNKESCMKCCSYCTCLLDAATLPADGASDIGSAQGPPAAPLSCRLRNHCRHSHNYTNNKQTETGMYHATAFECAGVS